LDEQWSFEGLAGPGVEQKAKGDSKEAGMLMLDAFKSLTTEIKATITSSSINTDLVIITWADYLKIAGVRCCGEQTVQRPPKAAV
jgi:hypothetical protein